MSDIDRREFCLGLATLSAARKSIGSSLTGATLEAQAAPAAGARQSPGKPKNVLLLMTDQHTAGALEIQGDTVAKTPNLDSLARSGVRFDHAYCADPVCVPSRASLLTGLYAHNHKAYNNSIPWPLDKKTMAHAFGQAGYTTALIGKMHFVDAQTHGFDYRLDFNDWYQYLGPKTRLRAEEIVDPNSGSGLPQIDDLWELHDPEMAKARIAYYYANLAQADDCVGGVLRELHDMGLDEDTIVLYTSDHGEMLGKHGLWQKDVFYDPAASVPLIVRAPGITPENAVCRTPVSLVQLFPTLTDLCGVPAPAGLDGSSFAGALRNPQETKDAEIFAELGTPGQNAGYMVRSGNFKYSYYPNDMPELYDLDADPEEMKNLALRPEYKKRADAMQARLFAWYPPLRQSA